MELRRYILIVWRWWWLIALGTVLAAGSAFLFSKLTTPIYSASTTLLINQAPNSTGATDFASLQVSERLARTYVELLRTPEVLDQVITQLGLETTPAQLAKRVQVKFVRDTQLIQMTVEDTDPVLAADIANKTAEVFKAWNEAQQLIRFASLKESLGQQIQQVDKSIAASQAEISALGAPRSPAEEARLSQLQTQLALHTSNYSTLQNNLAEARLAEAQAASSFKSSGYYTNLKDSLNAQIQQLEKDIAATQAEINTLRAPRSAAEEARLAQLQVVLTLYSSNYANLQSNLAQTRLVEGQTMNNVVVAQKAQAPARPIRPQTATNTALAGVVGALMGLGIAFLIEYLDDTIKSPDEVEQIAQMSTLGLIGYIEGRDPAQHLIAALMPRSPISEAYRTLRTNLQSSSTEQPLRSLVVTSGSPREGKTITVANLAVVLAQAGKRVVIVDSDLRRPALHTYFDMPNPHGLTNALMDDKHPVKHYLQETGVENLHILSSGPVPPNPAELLESHRLVQIIEELKQQADLVILDSPPVLAVTDAVVLSRQADGVLVIVQSSATRLGMLMRTLNTLKSANVHLQGVVVNRFSPSRSSYYSYDYYYSEDGRREKRHRSSERRWPWQRTTSSSDSEHAAHRKPVAPSVSLGGNGNGTHGASPGARLRHIVKSTAQQSLGPGSGKRMPIIQSVCDPKEITEAELTFQAVSPVTYGRFEIRPASQTPAGESITGDQTPEAALTAEAERIGYAMLRALDRLGFVSGNGNGPTGVRFSQITLCGRLAAYEVDADWSTFSVESLARPDVLAQLSSATGKSIKAFTQGGLTYVVELKRQPSTAQPGKNDPSGFWANRVAW